MRQHPYKKRLLAIRARVEFILRRMPIESDAKTAELHQDLRAIRELTDTRNKKPGAAVLRLREELRP